MKYYPKINMNRRELYALTRINLKSIMLSKRDQTQRSIYWMISFRKSLKTGGTPLWN